MESSASCDGNLAVSTTNIVFEEPIKPKKTSYLTLGEVGTAAKKGKEVHRLIHFSDGVLEEYSTEEEDEEEDTMPSIDPKRLAWLPWLWYYLVFVSSGALSVADTCGERLAFFFGITSPKYQYAIDEFERIKAEDEEENEMHERENEADRQRKLAELGEVEGGMPSAYAAAKPANISSITSTTGVANTAYEPESVPMSGDGLKY